MNMAKKQDNTEIDESFILASIKKKQTHGQ